MEVWTDSPVSSFIPRSEIEPEAVAQILNTASLPFIYKHVAVMPDCHYGKGSTVGTVIATKGAVVPAAVGVDIGCGMIAVRTSLKLDQLRDLKAIREGIERRIPVSFGKYNSKLSDSAELRVVQLEGIATVNDKIERYDQLAGNWRLQLGTLGSGNHFIELSLDEHETVWAVLHSGSRGIGNKIAQYHIGVAQEFIAKNFINLPDIDLAYLVEGTAEYDDYIEDLHWAQSFALANREEMMDRVMTELSYAVYGENGHQEEIEVERINCHHNYTSDEHHMGEDVLVTRKGAINADPGRMAFIPGSMGTRSYVVEGKGNPMSFNSAPHGAGRRMSRTKAKKTFTMEDFDRQLQGVEVRRHEAFIDELPGAYKDIDRVIEYAKPLVEVRYTLKQFLNVKGD